LLRRASFQSLGERLQAENPRQDCAKDAVLAVRITAILRAAAVAIFITAPEALTEVVVVVVLVYVIARIAVVGVLIGIRVFVVRVPAILPVCPSGIEAFLIAVIDGLPEQIRTVFVGFVVAAATIVTIVRGRVEVRIAIVVVIAVIPDAQLLLTHALQILLLKTVLGHALLLL
jgi:hypothetical protein